MTTIKKTETARKHSNLKVRALLNEISPLQMEQTRVRMQIAARIEDAMKMRGFNSQLEFARALKKQPSEISKWLSGTQNFTTDTLVEISQVLGVDLCYLLEGAPVQVIYTTTANVRGNESDRYQPVIRIRTPVLHHGIVMGAVYSNQYNTPAMLTRIHSDC